MNILALNTTSSSGSIAISQNNVVSFVSYLDIQLTHSERIMPQIDFGLKQCNLVVKDVDLICLTIGPGSFTGLRIGLATAKGIAYACNIPILPVNTLEALACNLFGSQYPIVPLLDAKMGEIYGAMYSPDLGEMIPPQNNSPELFLETINEPAIFIGDGALKYKHLIEQKGEIAHFGCLHQNILLASNLLSIGAKNPIPEYDFETISDLEPLYLRKSQAELAREARTGGKNGDK